MKPVRGCPSQLLKGKSKGGTIMVRVDLETHLQYAEYCKDNGTSMQKDIVSFIKRRVKQKKRESKQGGITS